MLDDLFRRVFPRRRARTDRPAAPGRAARPRLECLEDRLVPAVTLDGGVLSVTGTAANDTIRVDLDASGLVVTVNATVRHVRASAVRAIRIQGLRGNDSITVAPGVAVPTTLDGGPGNDWLAGGAGPNIFVGWGGRDAFVPFGPRDTLVDFRPGQDMLFVPGPAGLSQPGPGLAPFLGRLPAVTQGSFKAPRLLGTRTDLLPGAPDVHDRRHLTGPISYAAGSNPPTYGPHHPLPLPTGVYTTPQDDADLVHNLEHGHVWVSYNPALIGANLTSLQVLVQSFGPKVGVILTPRPQDPTMIALASWAHLELLTSFDAAAIRAFAVTNRGHAPEGFITP
jgi:hypothetical protein